MTLSAEEELGKCMASTALFILIWIILSEMFLRTSFWSSVIIPESSTGAGAGDYDDEEDDDDEE